MSSNIVSAFINGVEHFASNTEELIGHAADALANLGIGTFNGIEWFIQFLIQMQEDPVHVITRMAARIAEIGASIAATLEEIVNGIRAHGLTGYLRLKVQDTLTPFHNTMSQQVSQSNQLTTLHQNTLTTMQQKLDTLKNNGTNASWRGPSVDAMSAAFTLHASTLTNLTAAFNNQNSVTNTYAQETAIDNFMGLIAAFAILDLLIILCSLVAAPFTGGASVLAAGGLLEEAILIELAALLIYAEIYNLAWQHGTSGLYQGVITITQFHPSGTYTHALVPSGATLPNPDLTPEQEATAEALFNEFGGTVPRVVIDYLLKIIGTAVSAEVASAMIRCLYKGGYLTINSNSAVLDSRFTTAWNGLANHMDPNDLEGAWKDNNPDQVDPSTITNPDKVSNANHGEEVENALQSIKKATKSLNDKINYLDMQIGKNPPNINDLQAQKSLYERLRDSFTRLYNFVNSRVKRGSPPPDTWSDKGQIPFGEDILSTSHCNVPPYEPV